MPCWFGRVRTPQVKPARSQRRRSGCAGCARESLVGSWVETFIDAIPYTTVNASTFSGCARVKKTVIYFHSLSSPWAYLGGPRFHALIKKHDLDVVMRPTRIVPPNGAIPLLTRHDARRRYH